MMNEYFTTKLYIYVCNELIVPSIYILIVLETKFKGELATK